MIYIYISYVLQATYVTQVSLYIYYIYILYIADHLWRIYPVQCNVQVTYDMCTKTGTERKRFHFCRSMFRHSLCIEFISLYRNRTSDPSPSLTAMHNAYIPTKKRLKIQICRFILIEKTGWHREYTCICGHTLRILCIQDNALLIGVLDQLHTTEIKLEKNDRKGAAAQIYSCNQSYNKRRHKGSIGLSQNFSTILQSRRFLANKY